MNVDFRDVRKPSLDLISEGGMGLEDVYGRLIDSENPLGPIATEATEIKYDALRTEAGIVVKPLLSTFLPPSL